MRWSASLVCIACGDPCSPDASAVLDAGRADGGRDDGGMTDSGGVDAGRDAGADAASPTCPPPGAMTAESTVPGAITTPSPTLRNITIEWAITGDADEDGVVSVRY